MATMNFYGKAFLSAFNKEIDLGSDSIKILLLDNTYVPDQSHQYKSDLTGEITGDGYTAGGEVLTTVSVSYDVPTASFIFDADDVAWTDATITAYYAAILDDTPATDATKPLIGYLDFAGPEEATGGTVTIVWDEDGIAAVTVS